MTATALPAAASLPAQVAQKLDFPKLSDEMLGNYLIGVGEAKEELGTIEHKIKLEIERRLTDRGARALAHPAFEQIELVEEHTQYVADTVLLRAAADELKKLGHDDEAAKVVKHVPEEVTVIAAHDESGNPRSIHALVNKYGVNSPLGQLLSRALTRQSLGFRLKIKRRAA